MRRREAGRGAAPAGLVATGHPSGTTRSPCQELADGSVGAQMRDGPDESRARCRKMSQVLLSRYRLRYLSAYGAPRGARVPQGTSHKDFALFGAPSPLISRTRMRVAARSLHVLFERCNTLPALPSGESTRSRRDRGEGEAALPRRAGVTPHPSRHATCERAAQERRAQDRGGEPSPRRVEEKRHAVPFATMLDPWAINGHSVAGWRLPANLAG